MSDEPEIPRSVHLMVPIGFPREVHIVLTYSSEAAALEEFRRMRDHAAGGNALMIELVPRGVGHA